MKYISMWVKNHKTKESQPIGVIPLKDFGKSSRVVKILNEEGAPLAVHFEYAHHTISYSLCVQS